MPRAVSNLDPTRSGFRKFRKSAYEYFVHFLNTSSIHGLNHLFQTTRHPFERILWLILLILSIFGSVYLSGTTWTRYQYSPTVISLERDMFAWNTTFPAITLCPQDILDENKLDSYVKNYRTADKTQLKSFIRNLSIATFKSFDNLEDVNLIPGENFMPLLLNLSKDFKPKLTVGASNINLNMISTITEYGICYAVNSLAAVYYKPRYKDMDYGESSEALKDTFYVHPLDGEMFAQIINISTAYQVFIHGPNEVPDVSSKSQKSDDGFYMKIYVTALTVYTSNDAARLSVAQRKCRFPNEKVLKYSPIYSYTLCRIDCRIDACLELCGCVPHFYQYIGNLKICDAKGLRCLGKHYNYLHSLRETDQQMTSNLQCKCLPLCDDVNYVIQSSVLQPWYLGTNLQWGIVTYPRMRYRRDIIYGFTDLLVSVGSMAGLFLGCSVLSFVEILYFLTLKLFWFVAKNVKQN